MTNIEKNIEEMSRLELIMGKLLKTWEQRYEFEHDLEEPKLTFKVPNFVLTVVEEGESENVAILFEEAGTKHKAICKTAEAPKAIESLLFAE